MLLKFYLPNEDSGGEKIMTSHENQELPCWCFALVLPYNSVGVIFSPKMIIITNKQTKSLIFRVGIWWVVTITSQSIICLFVYSLSQRLRSSQSWRNPEKSKRRWRKREVKEKSSWSHSKPHEKHAHDRQLSERALIWFYLQETCAEDSGTSSKKWWAVHKDATRESLRKPTRAS